MELIKKVIDNKVFRYIFFGACTTFFNLAVFTGLSFLNVNVNIANFVSVVAAIIFAYFVNAAFVFESKVDNFKEKFSEFCKFIGGRMFTMIIEVGGVWLLVDIFSCNKYVSKISTQFISLVLNYVISKFIVFKDNK